MVPGPRAVLFLPHAAVPRHPPAAAAARAEATKLPASIHIPPHLAGHPYRRLVPPPPPAHRRCCLYATTRRSPPPSILFTDPNPPPEMPWAPLRARCLVPPSSPTSPPLPLAGFRPSMGTTPSSSLSPSSPWTPAFPSSSSPPCSSSDPSSNYHLPRCQACNSSFPHLHLPIAGPRSIHRPWPTTLLSPHSLHRPIRHLCSPPSPSIHYGSSLPAPLPPAVPSIFAGMPHPPWPPPHGPPCRRSSQCHRPIIFLPSRPLPPLHQRRRHSNEHRHTHRPASFLPRRQAHLLREMPPSAMAATLPELPSSPSHPHHHCTSPRPTP